MTITELTAALREDTGWSQKHGHHHALPSGGQGVPSATRKAAGPSCISPPWTGRTPSQAETETFLDKDRRQLGLLMSAMVESNAADRGGHRGAVRHFGDEREVRRTMKEILLTSSRSDPCACCFCGCCSEKPSPAGSSTPCGGWWRCGCWCRSACPPWSTMS